MKNNLTGLMIAAALYLCCAWSATAGSLKCVTPNQAEFPLIAFTEANGFRLAASLPSGREVFSQTYPVTVWCSISDPAQQQAEQAWFFRTTSKQTLGNGLTLFTTLNGDRSSEPGSISTGITIDNHHAAAHQPLHTWQRITLNVRVDIVKTGAAPGSLQQMTQLPARIPLFEIGSESGGTRARYMMLDMARGMTFAAHSCQIEGPDSFSVSLGTIVTHRNRGLGSGIASTSTGQPFTLKFICDINVSGSFDVMLRLDGNTSATGAQSGLLELNQKGLSARGVALQIIHAATGVPVILGQNWQIGHYPLPERRIVVPLLVRYYQTQERIIPGHVTAGMTWTLSYL